MNNQFANFFQYIKPAAEQYIANIRESMAALAKIANGLRFKSLASIRPDIHVVSNYARTCPPRIFELLMHLCSGDPDRAQWVLQWLAYPLQYPNAKMATALVISGPTGVGKSLFFEDIVARLYQEKAHVANMVHFHADFNNWMTGKRLVIGDDAMGKTTYPKIKGLITSDSIKIHRKGYEPFSEKNETNYIFLSSDRITLPPECNNRRFFVIHTPSPMSREFYEDVIDEIASGAVDHFRDFLMQVQLLNGFDRHTPPPFLSSEPIATTPCKRCGKHIAKNAAAMCTHLIIRHGAEPIDAYNATHGLHTGATAWMQ